MIRFSLRALLLVGLIASQTLLGQVARAQPAGGYWVVQQDGTVLRSGDMPRFYRVMDLSAGTVVEALGAAEGWTQVAYPAGSTAYVEADRAEKVNDTTVRLTKASNLLAPSALLGASGSWCPLFAETLEVGTELKLIEAVTGIGGTVSKYLVEAPRPPVSPTPARGFVRTESLRSATPAEVAAFQKAHGAAKPTAPEPVKPQIPETKPETKPEAKPVPVKPDPAPQDEVDTSLLGPIVKGPLTPPASPSTTPTEGTDQPNLATNGPSDPPAATHQDMVVLSINELNAAFDQLRAMPRDEQDQALEEMLAECRRTAEKLSSEPEMVRAVNQRVEWVNLRIRLRDQRRAITETLAKSEADQKALSLKVTEWRKGRNFTVIGRVFRSSLYDGKRLPLMYRIESIDGPGFGRTTAYLRPGEGDDFAKLVGAVVGVVGSPNYDDALGVRIIAVDSIEALDTP